MPDRMLDFRSDTVTRPTPAMRAAMANAEVGDDVLGDDPTVLRLQARVAELLGKEAAVFVPSGTMSNLVAVRSHCRPGDEIVCEAGCHIYKFEQGGYAQICGVAARTIEGLHGVLQPEQLEDCIRPDNLHYVRTRLVCLENTHNRGGGRIQPYPIVEAICGWARRHGLRTHLDGARLWNAAVATRTAPIDWARHFDSVSVCFSKGLGTPAGSALAGPRDLIAEAMRHRKVLGGGMRQAGVLAAAALYALDHHVERLSDDHANARVLAEGIGQIDGLRLDPAEIDTNLLFFHLDPALGAAAEFTARLRDRGLLMLPTGRQTVRAAAHLDVSAGDVAQAIAILKAAARNAP